MKKLLLGALFVVLVNLGFAQDLYVAAASDLSFVLPEIASQFQKTTGKKVALTFGSSGNFYQQIRNGAPFDVFFSADKQYPARLQQDGFAEPGSMVSYAIGKIVLYAPANSKLDVSRGLKLLLAPEVRKIAIANPQHAPYGRAAVEAMTGAGMYEQLKSRIVLGENISQTAQFVQSGNADVGILALSLTSAPAMQNNGTYYVIPESGYTPIQQAAVIVKASGRKEVAAQFLRFLKQPEIVSLMSRYGFSSPEPPH